MGSPVTGKVRLLTLLIFDAVVPEGLSYIPAILSIEVQSELLNRIAANTVSAKRRLRQRISLLTA
jgi:hypothetical protein